MGYRVDYGPVKKVRGMENRVSRTAAWTAVSLVLFVLLVCGFWPRGREVLRDVLFPGDWAVTAAAMETFVQELGSGEPVGAAAESFCRTILEEAGIGQG